MSWFIVISLVIGIFGGHVAPKKPFVAILAVFVINALVMFATDQANYGIWLRDYGWQGFILPSTIAGVMAGIANACKS